MAMRALEVDEGKNPKINVWDQIGTINDYLSHPLSLPKVTPLCHPSNTERQ